jgi:hypothetical protein
MRALSIICLMHEYTFSSFVITKTRIIMIIIIIFNYFYYYKVNFCLYLFFMLAIYRKRFSESNLSTKRSVIVFSEWVRPVNASHYT